jgi:hypothetical protein
MSYHPTVDTIAARLHREGWSMGHVAARYPDGCVWVVAGQRDGRWIVADGKTQQEAWMAALSVASKLAQKRTNRGHILCWPDGLLFQARSGRPEIGESRIPSPTATFRG